MATNRTSNYLGSQPKGVHAGRNTVVCRVSLSATFSVGDRYYIGKIPHNATVVDVVFLPGAAWAAAAEMAIGINGNSLSHEAIFPSDSYSLAVYSARSLARFSTALGNRGRANYSLSDERIVRYSDVVMSFGLTADVGGTAGHLCDVIIDYVLDDAT